MDNWKSRDSPSDAVAGRLDFGCTEILFDGSVAPGERFHRLANGVFVKLPSRQWIGRSGVKNEAHKIILAFGRAQKPNCRLPHFVTFVHQRSRHHFSSHCVEHRQRLLASVQITSYNSYSAYFAPSAVG
jgi:hypothetical protein